MQAAAKKERLWDVRFVVMTFPCASQVVTALCTWMFEMHQIDPRLLQKLQALSILVFIAIHQATDACLVNQFSAFSAR